MEDGILTYGFTCSQPPHRNHLLRALSDPLTEVRSYSMELEKIHVAIPFQKRLRRIVECSTWGSWLDVVSAVLSMFTVLLYIAETYVGATTLADIGELISSLFFALEYSLRFYVTEYRLSYFLSWESAIDLITIVPPFVNLTLWRKSLYTMEFGFFRFIRLLRLLRILRVHRLMAHGDSLIQRKAMVLIFTMISLVFCAAGSFLETEFEQIDNFHDALYWASITISTVGYGDFVPQTIQGKVVVMFTLIAIVTIVPYHTNELLSLMRQRSIYQRNKYVSRKVGRHVVVAGSISFVGLMDFTEEFYHSDHGFEDRDIVLLSPNPPCRRVELFVRGKHRVHYIEGSPMITKDLERASVTSASAIFILCDKQTLDPEDEDTTNLLISLAMAQHLDGSCPQHWGGQLPKIFIEVLLPQSRLHLESFTSSPAKFRMAGGIVNSARSSALCFSVLCVLELKLAMIAQSCIDCPGLIPLICNLCRSVDDKLGGKTKGEWHEEYMKGAAMEIYRTPLSPSFMGKSFPQIARTVFKETGCILIGIEQSIRQGPLKAASQLKLAPMDMVLTDVDRTVGFVLAPDVHACLDIATLSTVTGRVCVDERHTGGQNAFSTVWSKTRVQWWKWWGAPADIPRDVEMSEHSSGWASTSGPQRVNIEAEEDVPSGSSSKMGDRKTFVTGGKLPPREKSWRIGGNWGDYQARTLGGSLKDLRPSMLEKAYHVRKEPWSLQESTLLHVDFSGHILIFGISGVQGLFHLVGPLRWRRIGKVRPIILVDRQPPSIEQWSDIAVFQAVYFFQGSTQNQVNIKQLNITGAVAAIILPTTKSAKNDMAYHEARLDADVVLTYQHLNSINPELEIFIDINSGSNLAFFIPQLECKSGSTRELIDAPFFAAGMVFLSGFLDTLFCQAFYNPDIVRILRKLLVGDDDFGPSVAGQIHPCDGAVRNKNVPFLTQVPVPACFVNKSFGELFSYLLGKRQICLGLYRQRVFVRSNISPYVYTNPDHTVVLEAEDSAFVLSNRAIFEDEVEGDITPEEEMVKRQGCVQPRDSRSKSSNTEAS